MFGEYVRAGWVLCAVQPGTKGPRGDGWQLRENGLRDPAKVAGLMCAGICHAWSGTAALDIDKWDIAEKYLKTVGIELNALFSAPESVHLSSGRAGRGKLLYRMPDALPSLRLAPYKAPSLKDPDKLETFHALELRCATAGGQTVQDVLPPSIHPGTGQPYQWVYGDPLLGHWSSLPEIPAELRALWESKREKPTAVVETPKERRGATMDELKAILRGQDNDDYDNWIRLGNILHHETDGSMVGFAVWDQWSGSSPKYKGSAETQTKWKGFGKNTGNIATLGSLLQERVSLAEEFDVIGTADEPADQGVDTRLSSQVDDVLRRVVYLLDQERYYHKPLPKKDPSYTVGLDTVGDQGLKGTAFDVLYARHMPNEVIVGKGGEEKIRKIDPRQAVRFSPKVPKVNGIGFHPGAPLIFMEDGKRYLNEFEPLIVEPLRPTKPEQDAWDFLVSRIADPKFASWLLKFYAHALAKPGVKIRSAPLLISETPGTGKTTLTQTVPALVFGRRWVKEVSPDDVNKNFNAFLAGAWWVAIEELYTDGPRMDRQHMVNRLKPWITSDTIPVEFKGLNTYPIVNRVQPTASSNFLNALALTRDDRRWGVALMREKAITEAEKACLFGDLLDSPRASGVLRWLLQQENLTGFSPNAAPPDSQGKRIMVAANLGPWETTVAEAMAAGKAPFDRDIVEPAEVQDLLRGLSYASGKRVGMLLRKEPFLVSHRHCAKGSLYCWRNQAKWRKAATADWNAHLETGARPVDQWDLTVPIAIRLAAGEDGEPEEPDDVTDLLGALNG